jgi:hypothetical protein
MSPDFVYWLPLPLYRDTSHTIPALFSFCLPASFMMFWLYHFVIKPPLLALLPRTVLERLPPSSPLPWRLRNIVPVLIAILLGAFSHIVWDAFTHHDTLATQWLPFLEAPILSRGRHILRVYKFLQYMSTLVGVAVLAFYGMRWYQRTPPQEHAPRESLTVWQKAALLACLIVPSVIGAIQSGLNQAPWEVSLAALQKFVVAAVIAGIGIFSIVLLTLGLLWTWVERREG